MKCIYLVVLASAMIILLAWAFNDSFSQTPDSNLASNIFNNKRLILPNNVKNFVILIPNEAHEPPGLSKELRVINQPYVPQNVVANTGTTLAWFDTDIPHNHQVSVVDKSSNIVFDSGIIKFNTASKPLKLNESSGTYIFYETTKNPKYPNFVLNGTITVTNQQQSPSDTNSTSSNADTLVAYMVPAKELDKRVLEFKNKGLGIDSTYSFKSLRGGGSEAGGDTQEYLLVLASSGKDLNDVISALQKVTTTMPYT
jgi:hypothetical protein